MAITQEQLERWKDFAVRMARTCYKRRRAPTAKEIEGNVLQFFSCLDDDELASFVDWDHSGPYPKGSPSYCETRKPCWSCRDLFNRTGCPYCNDGYVYEYAQAGLICDMVRDWSDTWNPYYWSARSDAEYDRRDEQFCGPVQCCIRAGLDLAVAPSAGVMGFTAGDLRRMYPEGVPEWVTGGPDHRWETQAFAGEIPGVGLVPGERSAGPTFAEMPDDAGVWL